MSFDIVFHQRIPEAFPHPLIKPHIAWEVDTDYPLQFMLGKLNLLTGAHRARLAGALPFLLGFRITWDQVASRQCHFLSTPVTDHTGESSEQQQKKPHSCMYPLPASPFAFLSIQKRERKKNLKATRNHSTLPMRK